MKKKVYLDTTIPSYLYDQRDSIKNLSNITKDWWTTEKSNFKIYTSVESIAEASDGDYPNKDKCLLFLQKIDILPQEKQIFEIAQIYIDNMLMPKGLLGDAIHLAYTSFYKIDFLLTWNCNHLANANKKQHIQILNTKLNLYVPEITTPLNLFPETN